MIARTLFISLLALGCSSHTEGGAAPDGNSGGGGGGGGGGSADGGGGSANLGCKRGMAYGYDSLADLQALSPGVSWWYNWSLQPDTGVGSAYSSAGFQYVPMVWGSGSIAGAGAAVTADEHYLLTFNEPDFTMQSNLTPQQAADLWPQVEAIASAHDLSIVSPALNYCGGGCNETDPFTWFSDFFAACSGCKVDYLAVHWYACSLDALTSYIGQMKQYNLPIWLTEFSCLDTLDDPDDVAAEQAYMGSALAYLESEPAVVRYAWFTGRDDMAPAVNLLGSDGRLTALGQQYVSAPAACDP